MLQLELTGRSAVVTGATGELGRVIARTLAACGADVGIVYHGARERAQSLADEITAGGTRAVVAQADVGDEASVMAMRDRIVAALGMPTILVNNAVAQVRPWRSVLEQPLEDYDRQFRSCVMQNVLMARAFVPGMIHAGRGGRIIAISTEHGIEPLEAYEREVPLRRRGTDQDVAGAVAFLASDLARFITGQFLAVSGGTVMPAI